MELLDATSVAVYRRMTPAERWEQAFQLHALVRERVTALLRRQHPQWSSHELERAVAERMRRGTA